MGMGEQRRWASEKDATAVGGTTTQSARKDDGRSCRRDSLYSRIVERSAKEAPARLWREG
jgi:hypothetical protein